MTFEEALEALWEGKVIRRAGWEDPDRFCYLTLQTQDEGVSLYTANVTAEDSDHNDWYIWGYVH